MKKIKTILMALAVVCCLATACFASNQLVDMALWNANADQPSMGNVATANNPQALYNPTTNTLQFATNPVDVSGYLSGIEAALYDTTGKGDFKEVTILSTGTVETGTKNDGTNHTVTFLSSYELEVPSYLTKEGVEYITIKMRVPYTPMDVVVGTGYLDARLRIDWESMTATDWVEIVPNTEISAGEVESVTKTSQGIVLTAESTVAPSDCLFQVTKITSGTNYTAAAATLGTSNFDLYDIGLTLGGEDFALNGSVNLVLPYSNIPSVYRMNDGSKTTLRGLSSSDGYIISSRSLGLFAVVDGEPLEVVDTSSFVDISGHWAEETITNAVSAGLFNGTSATEFSPEAQMTNGMVITVLHRMAGSPSATATSSIWYAEAMAWGLEQGIIGGYTDFDGEANVTREALATMIYRYDGATSATGDLTAFADNTSISAWAVDGLTWANSQGIVTGKSATTIAPQNQATRAEVATMLWRYVSQ